MLKIYSNSAKKHKRNANFQIKMRDHHSIELFSVNFFQKKFDDIQNYPVRTGGVPLPEHSIFSSAKDYLNVIG